MNKFILPLFFLIISNGSIGQNKLIVDVQLPQEYQDGSLIVSTSPAPKASQPYQIFFDSAIVRDSKAKISIETRASERYQFLYKGKNTVLTFLFLQPGYAKIVFHDSLLRKFSVFKNPAGVDFMEFWKKITANKMPDEYFSYRNKFKELVIAGDTATGLQYYTKSDSMERIFNRNLREIAHKWIIDNRGSHINTMLIMQYLFKKVADDELNQLYKKSSLAAKNNSWGKELAHFLSSFIKGKEVSQLRLPDTSGKIVNVDIYKGKMVFIDFWASWCLPCRKQTDSLMSFYNLYKDKNFILICVSLDENKEKWKEAIKKDSMDGINVSDLMGFNGIAKQYQIKSIPANFLLDSELRIIDKDITIAQLKDYLKSSFKK